MSVPIDKTLAEIREEVYTNIDTVQDEYTLKGWLPSRMNLNKGVIRGLIELWNWGLFQLYQFMAYVLQQAFPKLSTGAWLDLHAGQVELTRRAATKATGVVLLGRDETTGNVNIAAGKIVRTRTDGLGNIYRFVTTEAVVLIDGEESVEVAVEAEQYGAGSNVTVGTINEIVTIIPGVDWVTNESDWLVSEGADEETDAELQARYALQWQGAGGASKYAYMAWALEVPGVVSVTILDQHPRGQGTVDVVIRSSSGAPTQFLIDLVDANIEGREPVNDDYMVKGPVEVPINLDLTLIITGGNPVEVMASCENRLRSLFTGNTLAVGQDLTMDLLIATAMGEHIKSVSWNSPIMDTVIDIDELAVLDSFQIGYSEAVEI
jgi:uncharacterized phage protein gp47/JayE